MVPFLVNGNQIVPKAADAEWLLDARMSVAATVAASLSFQPRQSYGYIDTGVANPDLV
ncbi:MULTISPECIES: hypothetical protein [Aerosakkonema]|uniref:hypothetical protein n=1 Tax=Aerosakkonema TaxID=1246629 RepID=UPI0035B7595E